MHHKVIESFRHKGNAASVFVRVFFPAAISDPWVD
jgi:hypothetical protein